MNAAERRRKIALCLGAADVPVSSAALSRNFGVSRQIIVRDIAAIKAAGGEIIATHYGYVLQRSPFAERVFKVRHTSEKTEEELSLIVSLGGIVVDVYVWHKIYGQIKAKLNISSKDEINVFLDGVRSGKSSELMHVTDGYHYHTVRAESSDTLDRIENALREREYLVAGE